jgi:thymidylate synthase ThyX
MVLILPEELYPFYDADSESFTEENALVTSWITRGRLLFEWYQDDLKRGLKPQIARDILPNLLKSEIFVTGRWSGWNHFIELRESPKAHPRIREIAKEVRGWFEGLRM